MLDPKTTYAERILPLKFGLPLFSPCSVRLGDVGFVKRSDGSFQTLYNIAQPDINIEGSPPPVNLVRAEPDTTEWQALHVHAKSTRKVEASSKAAVGGEARFQFSTVGAGDVILIPGDVVKRESLRNEGELKKYFKSHIKWIEQTFCAKENISPDELILVVGTVKTNRWAIAVNVHETVEAQLAFVVRGSGAKVWGEWSKSVGYEKCGPHAVHSALIPDAPDDEPRETIFINRIQLRGLLGKIETSNEPGFGKRIFNKFRAQHP